MKCSSLAGTVVALVVAAAPSHAQAVANISAEASTSLSAPLVAGLILIALGLATIKMARRKLSRLNWDSLD